MSDRRPDWLLPPGVDRGLSDYMASAALADGYDASLAESSLFRLDLDFVERHCPGPGRMLDLGCGTARLGARLAARGWTTVGVDLSQPMLVAAARKAIGPPGRVHLLRGNIVETDFLAPSAFDHAACLFSTLGMVVDAASRERAVRGARRALRPGGVFVVHVHNRWFRLWDADGRRQLLRTSFGGEYRMPVHQGVAGLRIHLFTRGEILGLLRRCGFEVVECRAISTRPDGRIPWGWMWPGLRAYGWLVAARAV